VYVIDPPGSSIFSFVTAGTMDAQGSTVTEGVGINRLTANFKRALVDGAFRGSNREAIEMVYWLVRHRPPPPPLF
jgi:cysteine synthase